MLYVILSQDQHNLQITTCVQCCITLNSAIKTFVLLCTSIASHHEAGQACLGKPCGGCRNLGVPPTALPKTNPAELYCCCAVADIANCCWCCCDLPLLACSGQFYLLHLEVINLLLVLTSTQLYSTTTSAPLGSHPFIDTLMQQSQLAPQVVQQALKHYILQPPLPPKMQLWAPSPESGDKGVLKLVRSAAGQLNTICLQFAWQSSRYAFFMSACLCIVLTASCYIRAGRDVHYFACRNRSMSAII